MIKFTAPVLKFDEQGEKTGWTYFVIPAELAQQLKPGNKKSFRVKGKLDTYAIKQVALMPMGDGDFIMPLNAAMRKGTGKRKGAILHVQLQVDESAIEISPDLLACLEDEPKAKAFFDALGKAEQNYYSRWIESAKTEPTKAKRIAMSLNGFLKGMGYAQMIRAAKQDKQERS